MRLFTAVFLCMFFSVSAAPAAVTVTPKRIVFEGRERSTEVTLINTGNQDENYRIFFQESTVSNEGKQKFLEEMPPYAASGMIVYSPRSVTIPPQSSQLIRLMLRKPKNLSEGEYRSRLTFREIPQDSGETLESTLEDGEVKMKLTPVFAITIAAIVRHGDVYSSATLSDIFVKNMDGKRRVALKINRSGNGSIYGDFTATYTSPLSKEETIVGLANGVAVYAEQDHRNFSFALNPPEGVTLRTGGKIHITYKDEDGALLAEATTTVP